MTTMDNALDSWKDVLSHVIPFKGRLMKAQGISVDIDPYLPNCVPLYRHIEGIEGRVCDRPRFAANVQTCKSAGTR